MRALNALSFRLANGEFLDDAIPLAALAQQPLHDLAKGAAAAAAVELPRGRVAHFRRRVRRRGGDAGGHHQREVGKVVAGVQDLAQLDVELLRQPPHFVELVQALDAVAVRAPHVDRRQASARRRVEPRVADLDQLVLHVAAVDRPVGADVHVLNVSQIGVFHQQVRPGPEPAHRRVDPRFHALDVGITNDDVPGGIVRKIDAVAAAAAGGAEVPADLEPVERDHLIFQISVALDQDAKKRHRSA